MTIKQKAQKLIDSLPEELTTRDLELEMNRLLDKLKIEEGLEASKNGQTISQDQVKERMARWLSE